MRTPALVMALCASLTVMHARADAAADARYIVEQTQSEAIFAGAVQALGPTIASAIENDLRKQGIALSDPQGFTNVVVDVFLADFTAEMQEIFIAHYQRMFTADQLAGIAAFYRSDAGQAVVRTTPELTILGAQEGAGAGQRVAQALGPRIARKLREAGIEVTESDMSDQLLEALE